jgi:hypothetical protein
VFGDALNILFSRRARDKYNSPPSGSSYTV